MNSSERPYANLGKHLKNVREQRRRSLAEVSGALEIDEKTLQLIEFGQKRPDEEVMLLFINYFDIQDQEALHLWELARYGSDLSDHLQLRDDVSDQPATDMFHNKSVVMMLAMDVRTMYSDGLNIIANKAGLTLDFTQSASGADKKPMQASVARLGMSYAQAEQVLRSLEQTLLRARYLGATKLLPPPPTNSSQASSREHR